MRCRCFSDAEFVQALSMVCWAEADVNCMGSSMTDDLTFVQLKGRGASKG
jgi:hypothetical protein